MPIYDYYKKLSEDKKILEYRYSLFSDKIGMLHHEYDMIDIKTGGSYLTVREVEKDKSENSLLFTATFFQIIKELGISPISFKGNPILRIEESIKFNKDSHDNKTGYFSLRSFFGANALSKYKPWELLRGRKWFHPRDLIFWSALDDGIGYNFLWLVKITNKISCKRTYREKKNGHKEITTSGKMLALTRVLTLNDYDQLIDLSDIIYKNPVFGSWEKVASIYFKDELHPTRYACKLLDDRIKSGYYNEVKIALKRGNNEIK